MALKWGWSDHHLWYLGWSSKSRQIWTRTPMPSSYHRFGAPSANGISPGKTSWWMKILKNKRWKFCPFFEQRAKKNMSIVFFGEMSFSCRVWMIHVIFRPSTHGFSDLSCPTIQQRLYFHLLTCQSRKSLAQNIHQGWRSDPQLSAKWNETIKPSFPSPGFVLFRCVPLGQFLGGPKVV